MHAVLLALILQTAPAAAPDTVVVCPNEFRVALAPWLEHREQQGHRIAILSNLLEPLALRGQIRQIAQGGKLRFVVLVGDADPAAKNDKAVRGRSVGTHYAKAKVNIHFGSEPTLATDNWYADLDGDRLPDVAIGRLTADSPAELKTIVKKILDYERNPATGLWRRRVNFVAGIGGFGALADGAIETGAKMLITAGVPAGYATSMTYGSWRSPYCPDPRRFREATLNRLNEGCLFWIYIGHGQRRYLDAVRVPGRLYPILSTRDLGQMQCQSGSPIAIFLACYTGAFDEAQDSLAEEMLRTAGAPVAAICASRVTMPYAMAVLSEELLKECFINRRQTLGEIFLHAKRNMVSTKKPCPRRQMLDVIGSLVSPKGTTLAEERAEHVELFNLIGDPMLRIRHPRVIEVNISSRITAGQSIEIQGTSPIAGRCHIELVARRDRLTFKPPVRGRYDGSERSLRGYDDVHRRANNRRWVSTVLDIASDRKPGGTFAMTLKVPDSAYGPSHARVFVDGKGDFAIGSANVFIRRPSPQPKPTTKP